MRILALGDVVGKVGREAITSQLPKIRKDLNLDFVIINGDNAAHGFGMTRPVYEELMSAGADIITGGDHAFDQKNMMLQIDECPNFLRPANFPNSLPGIGVKTINIDGKRLTVIHLQAQIFMRLSANCPFECVTNILEEIKLTRDTDAIIVDFHGEATSEKNAMGHYLDGKVSGVFGTHTHVPTNDARILNQGTAYITDIGMCGVYDSVIGFDRTAPVTSFLHKIRKSKLEVATGIAKLYGAIFDVNDKGLADGIEIFIS